MWLLFSNLLCFFLMFAATALGTIYFQEKGDISIANHPLIGQTFDRETPIAHTSHSLAPVYLEFDIPCHHLLGNLSRLIHNELRLPQGIYLEVTTS